MSFGTVNEINNEINSDYHDVPVIFFPVSLKLGQTYSFLVIKTSFMLKILKTEDSLKCVAKGIL